MFGAERRRSKIRPPLRIFFPEFRDGSLRVQSCGRNRMSYAPWVKPSQTDSSKYKTKDCYTTAGAGPKSDPYYFRVWDSALFSLPAEVRFYD